MSRSRTWAYSSPLSVLPDMSLILSTSVGDEKERSGPVWQSDCKGFGGRDAAGIARALSIWTRLELQG